MFQWLICRNGFSLNCISKCTHYVKRHNWETLVRRNAFSTKKEWYTSTELERVSPSRSLNDIFFLGRFSLMGYLFSLSFKPWRKWCHCYELNAANKTSEDTGLVIDRFDYFNFIIRTALHNAMDVLDYSIALFSSITLNITLFLPIFIFMSIRYMVIMCRKVLNSNLPKYFLPQNIVGLVENVEMQWENLTWAYIYWAVEKAGPVYVKLMQRIASRRDMFPHWLCFRCEKFQSNASAHAYRYTVLAVKNALNEKSPASQVWIEREPIGVGCIGQVHRGVLREKDNTFHIVAIKVLHPKIRQKLELDLKFIQALTFFLDAIPQKPWSSLRRSINEFAQQMLSQCNLLEEAENTMKFHENLSKEEFQTSIRPYRCNVTVPKVYWEYSTSTVLFESYEEGIALNDWIKPMSFTPNSVCWQNFSKDIENFEEKSCIKSGNHKILKVLLRKNDKKKKIMDIIALKDNISHVLANLRVASHVMFQMARHSIYRNTMTKMFSLLRKMEHYNGNHHFASTSQTSNITSSYYRELVAELGLKIFLRMVLVDNFVHADLHPGNILIRFSASLDSSNLGKHKTLDCKTLEKYLQEQYSFHAQSNCTESKPSWIVDEKNLQSLFQALPHRQVYSAQLTNQFDFEIVLIDCGLTASLSSTDYQNIKDLLLCLCLRDGYSAGRLILERAPRQNCKDPEGFCRSVENLLHVYLSGLNQGTQLCHMALGKHLIKMLWIAHYYRVDLDSSFLSLILASLLAEGVAKQLNPDLEILHAVLPYVKRAAVRHFIGKTH